MCIQRSTWLEERYSRYAHIEFSQENAIFSEGTLLIFRKYSVLFSRVPFVSSLLIDRQLRAVIFVPRYFTLCILFVHTVACQCTDTRDRRSLEIQSISIPYYVKRFQTFNRQSSKRATHTGTKCIIVYFLSRNSAHGLQGTVTDLIVSKGSDIRFAWCIEMEESRNRGKIRQTRRVTNKRIAAARFTIPCTEVR